MKILKKHGMCLFLEYLLIIGCVEKNPGPVKKFSHRITASLVESFSRENSDGVFKGFEYSFEATHHNYDQFLDSINSKV